MSHDTPRARHSRRTALATAGVLIALTAMPLAASPAAADPPGLPGSDLFVNPYSTTLGAAQGLSGQARLDAQLLGSIPSAEWLTKGTAAQVRAAADTYVDAAEAAGQMPVLVVYNLPFRDCAQYSAGGAENTAAYQAWIDGVAAGIGGRSATVILEPDGLGIIPWNIDANGNPEWCKPAELNPATAVSDRYAQLNYAVDKLKALGATSVYLDGTHSGWLSVADISDRLIKGGVEKADGFFLNASNYVQTERLQKFGTWIAECIHLSQNSWWESAWCGSQYYPANPNDFSTWGATDAAYDQAYADTGLPRDPAAMPHFVVDTSRNGQGPWAGPTAPYPGAPAGADPESWCNPPDRGAGEAPSTATGDDLIDAYLWIKVPGESDGKCYRGTGGPLDPERGVEDPAAGQWFPAQARELVALASPALQPLSCQVDVTGTKVGKGFAAAVVIANKGAAVKPWKLSWSFDGAQKVKTVVGGGFVQTGKSVTVTAPRLLPSLGTGKKTAFAITGTGAANEPWIFWLNGRPCSTK